MNRFDNVRLRIALLTSVVAAGCGDSAITAPVAAGHTVDVSQARAVAALEQLSSVRWNQRARDLVAATRTDPPMAARFYAMLGVAQQRAVAGAPVGHRGHNAAQRNVAVRAAVVAASAEILSYAFAHQAALVRDAERSELELLRQNTGARDDLSEAQQLGRDAAKAVIRRAMTDGADAFWEPNVPAGAGMWFPGSATQTPLRPLWGSVRPWLLQRGNQFRPPAPPAIGSPAFDAALREVRMISDTRSPQQLQIAIFWADGLGTATPPGHWNAIATSLIERYHLNEARAAETYAVLNMSLMDAGIACWDAKYAYWLLRPSQADPAITTPVGLPNFPSYVSGHATFSGAAATVLGDIFPAERRELNEAAAEAAMSRLYGGIHYRFDNEDGLTLGRQIGAIAVERRRAMRRAGGPDY